MTEKSKAQSGIDQEGSTASSKATARRGWFWPQNSKKAHYFVTYEGYPRALCGGWMLFAAMIPHLEDEGHDSPDNCAKCKLAWVKRFAPESDPNHDADCPSRDGFYPENCECSHAKKQ